MAMAWMNCALSYFPPSTANRKHLDSVPFLPPLRLTKRKNYLRTKLLKTLTKPCPPPHFPRQDQNKEEEEEEEEELARLTETLDIQQEEEESETSSDRKIGDFYGNPVLEEEERNSERKERDSYEFNNVPGNAIARVSEAPAAVSTRSATELVLYLVGIFVLQTVCAVWIFGSSNFDKKYGNEGKEADLGILGSKMVNGKKKGDFVSNLTGDVSGGNFGSKPGGLINVDNSELEEEIVKIRVMAREAREIEAKKLSSNELGSSTDVIVVDGDEKTTKFAVSRGKTNIQKEVDGRLTKLEKILRSIREKSTALSVSYLRNSSKVEEKTGSENLNAEVKDEKLMFKKKKKFRSYPKYPDNHSKGFKGGKDASIMSKSNGSNSSNFLAQKEKEGLQSPSSDLGELRATQEEDSHRLADDDAPKEPLSKLQEIEEVERESSGDELRSFQALESKFENGESSKRGVGMRSSNGKPSEHSVEPRKSGESNTNISHSFRKEVEHKPRSNDLRDRLVDIQSDLWWMKLPYVLAILLRRGPGQKAPKGLYTLKLDGGSSSYTIAFEDRRDATNFSYILESFFEDLDDVSADIVPLSIEEIKEALKSSTMKLIVVRKGQLHLYAGQPLGEVEMALRTIG